MNPITKWLKDSDAADYPFPYEIGDRLKSPTKNIQGTFRNAEYDTPEQPDLFWITYYMESINGHVTMDKFRQYPIFGKNS